MSAFRAKAVCPVFRLATAVVIVGAMGVAGAADAQVPGPPIRLEPKASGDVVPVPPGYSINPPPAVTVLPLAPPVWDAAGVLTPAEGGLGPALWVGSPVGLVQRLLAELPVAAPSPTQHRLTLRLLLSAAEPPAGDETGRVLAALRVAKLAALGAGAERDRLLAMMPGGRADSELARILTEAPAADDPAGLVAVARSEAADSDVRADAAERAAAAGALSENDLAAAYASVRFEPAALARPLTAGEPGARGRALVYQATVSESQPAVLAELIGRWLNLLEPVQAVGPVAALPLAVLRRLPVDPATAWLAPAAVRASWGSGRPEAAAPWLQQPLAPADAAALLRLWPLSALSGGEGRSGEGDGASKGVGFDAWLAAALTGADPRRRARVAGVLALLQAAGEPVKEEAWIQTADQTAGGGGATGAAVPSPALWQTLTAAAAGRRVGEVVLVALTMLGNGGPQALPPVVLAQVVTCLREVGLSPEARGLAREAVAALLD